MRIWMGFLALSGLVGCGQPHSLDSGEFDFARSISRIEPSADPFGADAQVTLQNTDFQSPRRIERALTQPFHAQTVPVDVLTSISQKIILEHFAGDDLDLLHVDQRPHFNYVTYQQMRDGRTIVGARLIIRLSSSAEWMTMSSTLLSQDNLTELTNLSSLAQKVLNASDFYPRAHQLIHERSVIYPRVETDGTLKAFAAREFAVLDTAEHSEFVFWVDEAHEEILGGFRPSQRFDQLEVTGSIATNQPEGLFQALPLAFVKVIDAQGHVTHTTQDGRLDLNSLSGSTLSLSLDNDSLLVLNDDSSVRSMSINISELKDGMVSLDAGLSEEERTIYYWVMFAKKFLKDKFGFDRARTKLTAIARFGEDLDNAFFMPLTYQLAFGTGKTFLKNTGLSRDVIIHEFGHSVIFEKYGMVGGYEFSAMNEAMSDFLAATITDDPWIGEGVMQERTGMKYLRTVDNEFHFNTYPRGRSFHNDGQMFSGALWRLRKYLGKDLADTMIHEAQLAQAKTVHEFYRELLAIDEMNDDGDPWTQSPNEALIRKAFRNHGLGSRDVSLADAPPKDLTEDWKRRGCWSSESELSDKNNQTN